MPSSAQKLRTGTIPYYVLFQVKEIDNKWEDAQFNLANYYYKWSKALSPGVKHSMMPHVIKHYGESLKYGSNNIFQSMPRLLTTWFELEGMGWFAMCSWRRFWTCDGFNYYESMRANVFVLQNSILGAECAPFCRAFSYSRQPWENLCK